MAQALAKGAAPGDLEDDTVREVINEVRAAARRVGRAEVGGRCGGTKRPPETTQRSVPPPRVINGPLGHAS